MWAALVLLPCVCFRVPPLPPLSLLLLLPFSPAVGKDDHALGRAATGELRPGVLHHSLLDGAAEDGAGDLGVAVHPPRQERR